MTGGRERIRAQHLERTALVYVRQSTPGQVMTNRESQQRQYALAEQARQLGWPQARIRTIDTDLGVSGARAGQRAGFAELLDEVKHGRAGAVLGLEVSRLARNALEWVELLFWCRKTDTLLVEGERIYALSQEDDSLVLGIKGTISETELRLIRERLRGGLLSKAKRGELYRQLPIGFVREGDRLCKDPDRQVQQAIAAVFARFREHGSARQAAHALREEGCRLPARGPGGREMRWNEVSYARVIAILKNPAMGGAYVYGRQRTKWVVGKDGKACKTVRHLPREEWEVLIEDRHEGYVSWQEWRGIQAQLAANSNGGGRGALREGRALLQGLVVCGQCGRAMRVSYGKGWNYSCPRPRAGTGAGTAGGGCATVGGKRIDAWVAGRLLEVAQSAGVETAVRAWKQQQEDEAALVRSHRLEVERCAYEERLADRRYSRVDPDNRNVAATLEARWEQAVVATQQAQAALERAQRELPPAPDWERLSGLGQRLRRVWEAECVTPRDRKRLLGCLVEEVLIRKDAQAGVVRLVLRWQGGELDEHEVPSQAPARRVVRDDVDTVTLVRQLARHYPDVRTAEILNRQQRTTARGLRFSKVRVAQLRARHGIAAYRPRAQEAGAPVLGIAEAARELQTTDYNLYRWIRKGLLPTEPPVTPGAPYRIRLTVELRQRFCVEVPAGFVRMQEATRRLGVTRQRIWQQVREGKLEARHVVRGVSKGTYVRLTEPETPLLDGWEPDHD